MKPADDLRLHCRARGVPEPVKRRQPERAEQAAIVSLLRKVGASVYVLGTTRAKGDFQGTRQTPGLGDLFCVLPMPRTSPPSPFGCTPLWIEVKAPNGRPSEAQKIFRLDCQRAGLHHVLGGVDAVIAFLAEGGWVRG